MSNFEAMKLIYLIILFIPGLLAAQGADNCVNANTLCANQTQFSSNENATVSTCNGCEDGASSSGNFCYSLNNSIWFTFLTNDTGGDVVADISNIVCDNTTGYNTSLQATIIQAAAPCDESTYQSVSNCETSSINFQLSASNLQPNTTYYIQVDGDSLTGDTNPASCGFSITVSGPGVDISIEAGEGSSIFKGESATIEGEGPSNATWTPADLVSNLNTPSNTVSPQVTTTYFYSTQTANGCIYTDDVTVVVQEALNLTNTFSPNDDGINDYWYIGSIENFPSAKITIFDRWGQKVYHSVGYGNENVWTGKASGITVPSGVYYYIIDLNTSSDEDVFNGYVTVIK